MLCHPITMGRPEWRAPATLPTMAWWSSERLVAPPWIFDRRSGYRRPVWSVHEAESMPIPKEMWC